MTDDQILAAAERIKARRRNDELWAAFLAKDEVMVRWDVPYSAGGQSFASVMVSREAIQSLVREKLGELSS